MRRRYAWRWPDRTVVGWTIAAIAFLLFVMAFLALINAFDWGTVLQAVLEWRRR
jgi:hypothetical protein